MIPSGGPAKPDPRPGPHRLRTAPNEPEAHMAQAVLTPPGRPGTPAPRRQSSPAAQGTDHAAPPQECRHPHLHHHRGHRAVDPAGGDHLPYRRPQGLLVVDRVVPTTGPVRHPDAVDRHLPGDDHRHGGRRAPRPGCGDLPLGIRQPSGPKGRQAHPRDPGRHPERRAGLLRPHATSIRSWSSASSPTPPCSTSRRRASRWAC